MDRNWTTIVGQQIDKGIPALRQKTFRRFLTQDLFKILIDLWHPTIIETIQLFRLRQV